MAVLLTHCLLLAALWGPSQGAVTLPGVLGSRVSGALSLAQPVFPRPLPPSLSCLHPCQKLSCKAGTTCRLVQRCVGVTCSPEPACVQQSEATLETPGEVSDCGPGGAVMGEAGRELQCGPGSPCPRGTGCRPSSPGAAGRCCLLPPPGCPFRADGAGTLTRSRQPISTSGSQYCPRPSLLSSCLSDCLTAADCRFGEFCCPSICGTKTCVKVFEIVPDSAGPATSGSNPTTAPDNLSTRDPGSESNSLALNTGFPRENFVRVPGRLSRQRGEKRLGGNRFVIGQGVQPPAIDLSIAQAQADVPASLVASDFRCPNRLRVYTCRNQCASDADCSGAGRKCCPTRCGTGICASSHSGVAAWLGK